MSDLTKEEEAELLAVYDEREAAAIECAPEVALKLGLSDVGEAQFFLTLPCLTFGQTQLLPFRLHPAAIRQFAKDLLSDESDAHAARQAVKVQQEKNQALGEVYMQEYDLAARKQGLNRSTVAQDEAAHKIKLEAVSAAAKATEAFLLALGNQVMAGNQVRVAIQQWASRHWPEERNTIVDALLTGKNRENGLFTDQIGGINGLAGFGDTKRAPNFYIQTGQETDWLMRAASDGARGTGYRKDEGRGALIYETEGASHRLELLTNPPTVDGETLELSTLETLVGRQNADFGFAFFYVCHLLTPPSPLPRNSYAGGWVDLDDVATKIGYDLNGCTKAERERLRASVWDYLNYGARALVIGQRKNYRDKHTGKDIETRVESPPWRILNVERPVQTAMFGEVPRRVELLISKEWEPLLSEAHLAQYLPFAESIAAIPANQTAGAWARVIGVALASFWRRKPQETIAGTIRPTRRELLTHYTPKKNPPLELLSSSNPKRAVEHWCDALTLLVEKEFLAKKGEALRSVEQMLKPFGRKGWQDAWLDERVELWPGALEWQAVKDRADAKYTQKPRALAAPKRKPGRPKKRTD